MPEKNGISMIGFHVTYKKNLKNILKKGLIPSIGERAEQLESTEAIYLFESIDAVEDALMNWLGDELDEDEEIVILEVNLEGLPVKKEAFELQVPVLIEPKRILEVFTEQGEALFQKTIKSFNDLDILTGCVNNDTVEEDKGILWNKKAIADSNLKRNTIKQSMPISSPSTQTGNKRLKKQSCPTTDGCFQKKQKLESFTERTTIYSSKIMQKCFLKNPKEVLPLTNLKGLNPKVHDLKLLQKYQEEIIHTYKTNPANFNLDNIREISKESKNSITGFFRLKLLGDNYLRLMVKGRYVKNSKNFYIEKVDSIRLRYQDTYEDFKKEIKKSKSGFPEDFIMDFHPPSGYWGWPWGNPDPYQGHHPMDYKVDDRNQLFGQIVESTNENNLAAFYNDTCYNDLEEDSCLKIPGCEEIKKCLMHSSYFPKTLKEKSIIMMELSNTLENFVVSNPQDMDKKVHQFFLENDLPEKLKSDLYKALESQNIKYLEQIQATPKKRLKEQITYFVRFKFQSGYLKDNIRIEFEATELPEISSTLFLDFVRIDFRKGFYKKSFSGYTEKERESLWPLKEQSIGSNPWKGNASEQFSKWELTSMSELSEVLEKSVPESKNLKQIKNNLSVGIPGLEKIAQWYIDHVFKDPTLPLPKFKIVNHLRSKWLGQCLMQANWEVPEIHLQKTILNDEKTLDRIIAHEMVHFWQYLRQPEYLEYFSHGLKKVPRHEAEAIKRKIQGQGHGSVFKEWAAKINQIKGADYVTETSDESYTVEDPNKEFFILIEPATSHPGKYLYNTFSKKTANIKKALEYRIEKNAAKLFKVKDQNLLAPKSLELYGGAYFAKEEAKQEKLKELYEKGQQVTASEIENGFTI